MKNYRSHGNKSGVSCQQAIFRCGLTFIICVSIISFILINFETQFSDVDLNERILIKQLSQNNYGMAEDGSNSKRAVFNVSHIHVGMVTCGSEERMYQMLVSLKSVVLLAQSPLYFHLFADTELHGLLQEQLQSWPVFVRQKFDFMLYPIIYPQTNKDEWRAIFKPCASLRLFFTELLPQVDAVIYLDTDTISVSPVDHLHSFFRQFNDSHSMALVPDSLDAATAWYPRFARHPFYGKLGLNSGVMLMNLTRMRQTTWFADVTRIYNEHKLELVYGDQDIINIWLSRHPDQVLELPCEYNYLASFCTYRHFCLTADVQGVKVVHGNRGNFHRMEQPFFKRLYDVFAKYDFQEDLRAGVLDPLVAAMSQPPRSGCGAVASLFYKGYQTYLDPQ